MHRWWTLAWAACSATWVMAQPAPALTPDAAGRWRLTAPSSEGPPALSRAAQLVAAGYVEAEYWLQGRAQAHEPLGPWSGDGRWAIRPAQGGRTLPYGTRLLVRRPADPARFNGVVLVEWLNTTFGFDLDGMWMLTRDEVLREGYAWVGVSAQPQGDVGLLRQNPRRYESLGGVSAQELSFEVFSHAAQSLRRHGAELLGLGTLRAAPAAAPREPTLLAVGYSNAAMHLFTYINAFQPQTQAFDGFLLHGAAPMAMPLDGGTWGVFNPRLRTDSTVPVLQVQTEMEVTVSWPLSATPDSDRLRYWEVAAAPHFGPRLQDDTQAIAPEAFRMASPDCWRAGNTVPVHVVDHAALHALKAWVVQGVPAPSVSRLRRHPFWGHVEGDELGHARGGVRLPEVAAPVARQGLYGNVSTSFRVPAQYACVAGGTSRPLGAQALRSLYASPSEQPDRYREAAQELTRQGLMRPADRDQALGALSR